jgi:hypothetical protein
MARASIEQEDQRRDEREQIEQQNRTAAALAVFGAVLATPRPYVQPVITNSYIPPTPTMVQTNCYNAGPYTSCTSF